MLTLQVILMSYFARNPETEQSIAGKWLLILYTPVAKAFDKTTSGVASFFSGFTELRGAKEENTRLKSEIEQLIAERDSAREEASKLKSLEEQFAMPPRPQYPVLAANVISRNPKVWFKTLYLDRGTLDGVRRNMPVATPQGIVGRVISVGPNYSQVQVITDTAAGAGAMLQTSRTMGVLSGTGTNRCDLKGISDALTVQAGDIVVTTGLDRIYPKGLVIGTVERIESDPNGPWHKITVVPTARVDSLEQVLIYLVEEKRLDAGEAPSRRAESAPRP